MAYKLLTRFPDHYREPLQTISNETGDSINLIVVEAVSDYLRERQRGPSAACRESGRATSAVLLSPRLSRRRVALAETAPDT